MSILYRFLIRQVFKYTGMILLVVTGIYLAVDFFEKIDNFMEVGLPLSTSLIFFIHKIPFIIEQIAPVCLLLAILIVFGLMNKHNEIIALKSCGISVYYLLMPLIATGALFSFFLFFLSEEIVPVTMAKANMIWRTEVRKGNAVLSKEKNIWIKGKGSITHIVYYNFDKKQIFGMTRNFFDQDFKLIKRIDAEKAVFKKGKWVSESILEQYPDKKNDKLIVKYHDKKTECLDFTPHDLKRVVKKSEEMNFREISAYIKKVEDQGYEATRYKVDLYGKTAFPLVCIIMALVGTGIALRVDIKHSLPASIAYGIGIAFLYWIFYSFCMSLGYGEMLPPVFAAWTGNLVFLCFGVFTLIGAE
jgi:lipopolysaccharide export system permease protein